MVVLKCAECKGEVSTKAKDGKCPHCGFAAPEEPVAKGSSDGFGPLILVALIVIFCIWMCGKQ